MPFAPIKTRNLPPREAFLPALVFALGVIITAFIFLRSATSATDNLFRQFEKETMITTQMIMEDFREVSHGLFYLKSFFEQSVSVETDEFRNFVKPYLAGNSAVKTIFALSPSDSAPNSFHLSHMEPSSEGTQALFNSDFESTFKIRPGTLARINIESFLHIPNQPGHDHIILVSFQKNGRRQFVGATFSPAEIVKRVTRSIPPDYLDIELYVNADGLTELLNADSNSSTHNEPGPWGMLYPYIPDMEYYWQFGGTQLHQETSAGPQFLRQHYSLLIWLIWPLGIILSFLASIFTRKILLRTLAAEELADETAHALGSIERSLAITLRSIGDALIATDTQGRITRLNPVAEQLTGWPSSEAIGRPLQDVFQIIDEETRGPIEDPVQLIMRTGKVTGLANHTILIARNGNEYPISDRGAPIINETGNIEGVVLVFRDATEERAARKAIEDNEKRLRLFYLNMKEGVAVHRLVRNEQEEPVNYQITDVNNAYEQILGMEKSDIVGHLATEVYKADHPPYLEIYAEVVRTQTPHEFTTYFHLLDKYFIVSVISYQPDEFTTVFLDITERHKADLESRRSKEKLASIFRAAPAAIGILQDRTLVEFNDHLYSLLGYHRDEIIGRSTRMLYENEEEYQRVGQQAYAQLKETGTSTVETRWRAKDGKIINILLTHTLADPENPAAGTTFSALDITARIQAEKTVRTQEAYLRSVFNNMPFLMWLKDKDGRFLSVNDVFAESCGLGNSQFVLGKTDFDVWPRELAEKYRADDQAVMDSRHQRFTEELIADAAGTRWFETYKIPIMNAAGDIMGTTGFARDITNQKRAEEALRKEKELAQSYLDVIGSVVVVLNPEGRVTLINKAGCELLGYSHGEILYKDWISNFLPEKARDEVRTLFGQIMNGNIQTAEFVENSVLTKDGQERIIAWHNTLLQDSTGQIISSLSSGQDVTEIRAAQAALKDSEERFRNIFNSANDGIFIHDAETGAIVDLNEKATDMYGGSREEIMQSRPEDFSAGVPPYTYHEAIEWIHKARSQGPQVFQWYSRHKSGRLFWTEISMRQAMIGGMDRIIVSVRDITDRKLIEDALQMKTDELDRFFTSTLDMLCIADIDGYFRRLNPIWQEILGYELWELEGRQFMDLVHPDDIQSTQEAMANLGQEKEVLNFVNRFLCKDGSYRWLEWRSLPFGNMIYASARDITERMQVESALQESEEKLRLMFETSPIGMAMCEMNGALIQANQAYLNIIGYTYDETMKLTYWDLTPKEYAECEQKQLRSMEETGKYGPYEKEYIRKTGERVPVLLSGMTVTGADGVKRIWSLVEDVTNRKLAEKALKESEERLKLALDASKDGMWDYYMDGRCYNSPRYYTMLGYEDQEFPASFEHWQDLMHPDDKAAVTQGVNDYLQGRTKEYSCEFRMRTKNGDWRWILSRAKAVEFTPEGKPNRIIGTHTDITEMKRVEQMIAQEKNLLKTLINNLPDSIYVKDLTGKKILTNRADIDFIGAKNEADVLGKTDAEVFPSRLAEQYQNDDRIVINQAHPVINREEIIEGISGEKRWLLTSKLPLRDETGKVTGLIGIGRDITDRKLLENKLLNMAHYDTLTTLPNRTLFFERVSSALARAKRSKIKCALLFVDLDHFKKVNDTLGHTIGDELIKDTARKLGDCVRESDTLARLGGDEFIIFLSDLETAQTAQRIAERIREKFNTPRIVSGNDLFITASIGISVYPDDGLDIEELLKNADTAMYAAKDIGRNAYCFFNNQMNQKAVTRMQIERGLRDALIKEEFVLYYQPVINLQNGKIRGFEALLRWFRKEGGLVFPAEFIPVAEETGLIVPIGEWVLKHACQFNQRLIELGYRDLIISVNMSVAQLRRKNLVNLVREALAETRLPPELLELELTESIFVESFDQAIDVLRQIRDMGVNISLDDFGTGYSSLSHLQHLPIINLKMDRIFVNDIAKDEVRSKLAGSIIDLAHKLKLEVIAEGVETKEQLERLKKSRCDFFQGYLLSKPVPPDKAIELLANNPNGFPI